ncbi:MAG TPA: MotA/TolQ/ExbB proton channel family protein, partial [Anaeromyxobacteraceae bacterium]|nr:MotA/TolQ/ExbB proton channel family protein [Anaeromyxobacteraceae bacterium]
MDITTIAGIVVGFGLILLGQVLEGGHAGSLVQASAAVIVFGGTLGATLVTFPMADFLRGMKLARLALFEPKHDLAGLAKQLVEYATIARRDGVLALEGRLKEVGDPFLRRGLQFVVDGVDASVTRSTLETAYETEYEENAVGAKVWESMGGYAPTIGI